MPRIRSFSLKLVVLFFGAVSAYANRPNTTDVLNRTLAWTHSQNKTVKVTANPQARVWFNDTEIENINYTNSQK